MPSGRLRWHLGEASQSTGSENPGPSTGSHAPSSRERSDQRAPRGSARPHTRPKLRWSLSSTSSPARSGPSPSAGPKRTRQSLTKQLSIANKRAKLRSGPSSSSHAPTSPATLPTYPSTSSGTSPSATNHSALLNAVCPNQSLKSGPHDRCASANLPSSAAQISQKPNQSQHPIRTWSRDSANNADSESSASISLPSGSASRASQGSSLNLKKLKQLSTHHSLNSLSHLSGASSKTKKKLTINKSHDESTKAGLRKCAGSLKFHTSGELRPGKSSTTHHKMQRKQLRKYMPKSKERAFTRNLSKFGHKKPRCLKLQQQAQQRDESESQLCMFYVRTGRCSSGKSKCRFKHDPDKVAICSKWLANRCDGSNCPLTHKVVPERMPVCSYFLHGICSNPFCPYRHVKVNENAPPCESFLKGFCPRSETCERRHSYVCPLLEVHGKCEQREKCPYYHPAAKESRGIGGATSGNESDETEFRVAGSEELKMKRRKIENSATEADIQTSANELVPSFAIAALNEQDRE